MPIIAEFTSAFFQWPPVAVGFRSLVLIITQAGMLNEVKKGAERRHSLYLKFSRLYSVGCNRSATQAVVTVSSKTEAALSRLGIMASGRVARIYYDISH